MNTLKRIFFIIVVLVAMTAFLTPADQIKANLIRYYQDLCTWMQGEDYRHVMNDYDKVIAKQDQIAERYGFADLEKVAETAGKYAEDSQVMDAQEKFSQLSQRVRAENNKANTGKIIVNYQSPKKPSFKQILTLVKESQLLKFLAEHVQSFFFLPRDLTISLEECKENNAFYDSEKKKIIICYEMLNSYKKFLDQVGEDEVLLVDFVMFDTLHEFGHAVIDLYDLPVTGKEEDVADQIATWLILETIGEDDTESIESVLNAAYWFALEFDKESVAVEDLAFWDSHSLDPQRYHNIICWAYGYDPELTAQILESNLDELLPKERRGSCEHEYYQMSLSFTRMLDKYLKE